MSLSIDQVDFIEQIAILYTTGGQTAATVKDAASAAAASSDAQKQVNAIISIGQLVDGFAGVFARNQKGQTHCCPTIFQSSVGRTRLQSAV